jgi:hypothetical protein
VGEELNRAIGNPLEFPSVVTHLEDHGCFPPWVRPRALAGLRPPEKKDINARGDSILKDLVGFFEKAATRAIEEEIPVRDRNLLALALGWLGDPRVAVDLRVTGHPEDHPAYMQIPAGQYYFGDPKKRITIQEPFWLSKYPVTNSQFALFIDDNGYGRQEFWSDEGWRWKSRITGPNVLEQSRVQCAESAGGWRQLVGGGSVLQLGGRIPADGTAVGSRCARAGWIRVSLGK